MPDLEKIIVLVADEHCADLDQVACRLRTAGMRVDEVLAAIGVITGAAEPGAWAALGALAEVVSVEPDKAVRARPSGPG